MQSLWRKASWLFWQYPVLWLPVLVADLAGSLLNILRKIITHQVTFWLQPGDSVFSHHSVLNLPAGVSSLWLLAPLNVWTNLMRLCLYSTAFVLTGALIKTLDDNPTTPSPNLRVAIRALPAKARQILIVSVVILIASPVAGLLGAAYSNFNNPPFGLNKEQQISATVVLALAALAFATAPFALRLAQPSNPEPLPEKSRNAGRILATLAVAASGAISLILQQPTSWTLASLTTHDSLERNLVYIMASCIAAIPYIPLFIALALIALHFPMDKPIEDAVNPAIDAALGHAGPQSTPGQPE